MLIQRQFNDSGECTHVAIKHTGKSAEQNFSHRLIEGGMAEGWISIDANAMTLTMKAEPEPLRYALKRRPGYYCASTGKRIPVSDIAWTQSCRDAVATLAPREARQWLKAHGKAETDYEVTRAYECVLDSAQHEKYRAVVDPVSSNVVAANTVEA